MLQTTLLLTLMYTSSAVTIPHPTGHLEVYALPVGQGDCTIIQCPAGQLVINDCGSSGGNKLSVQELKDYLGNRVDNIVTILVSHPHTDHYNYLYNITDHTNENIQQVIIGGRLEDYPNPIQGWLRNFSNKLAIVSGGRRCIGTCLIPGGTDFCNNASINFTILAANIDSSANQQSIVLKVTAGPTFSILLPGDIESPATTSIVNSEQTRPQLQSLIYKIAHHGATNANRRTWLAAISPQRAFASNAYNFGNCRHPRCDTIDLLVKLGSIRPATPHVFYCNINKTSSRNYLDYSLDIYETSPTRDLICFLTYSASSSEPFAINCIRHAAAETSDDSLEYDECPSEGTIDHSEGLLAQYVIVMTTIMLSVMV